MDRAVQEVAISSKPTQRNKENSHSETLRHNKKPDLKTTRKHATVDNYLQYILGV